MKNKNTIRNLVISLIFLLFLSFSKPWALDEEIKSNHEEQKTEVFNFEVKEFTDGLVGRRYNFVFAPEKATPPYTVTLVSGTLPPGLTLDQRTGGIDGKPSQSGEYGLVIRVADAQGKIGTFSGSIKIWRILAAGEHGTFKGFDGIQMALNVAQDMDEIRIERGTYEGTGLSIPEGKKWSLWIKISGGWNEIFEEKSNDPGATILDGGGKESGILTIPESEGKVSIENLTFRNSKGSAVESKGSAGKQVLFITNCTFTQNSAGRGGAVDIYGSYGTFTNCTFIGNLARGHYDPDGKYGKFYTGVGGAVAGNGTFTNCTFTGNSTSGSSVYGGAIAGYGIFTSCTFTGNSASGTTKGSRSGYGGAVAGVGTFTNCTFSSNLANREGSAVYGSGTFNNCTFAGNNGDAFGAVSVVGEGSFTDCTFTNNNCGAVRVGEEGSGTFTDCTFAGNNSSGGAVSVVGEGSFTDCTFTGNATYGSGGAVWGGGTFTNCAFTSNSAEYSGGAVSGGGTFRNCTFISNSAGRPLNGGAISTNGNWSLVNCLFYKNSASSGGAIEGGFDDKGEVINCTFYGNNAKEEGGAINSWGEISIINSIFYKNTAGGKDNDIAVTGSMEIDYSLVNYFKGAANFGPHNIMGNPKFVDSEQNDFHLRPDSPCINAGNEVQEAFKEQTSDLDRRPRVVGGKIDMGAYEWQGE